MDWVAQEGNPAKIVLVRMHEPSANDTDDKESV
jgi:hypothetical protein